MIALLSSIALAQSLPPVPASAPEARVASEAPVAPEPSRVPTLPVGPKGAASTVPLPIQVLLDGEVVTGSPVDDLFTVSGKVVVDHEVSDNAFLFAGDVEVQAPVRGDVYVTAGEARIDAPVQGDVYAMGGELELTENAAVAGHVRAFGGQVEVHGPVGGSVEVGAGQLVISSVIGGDVTVQAGQLELIDGATIGGDLDYETPSRGDDIDHRVAGTVQWTRSELDDDVSGLAIDMDADEESSLLAQATWWTLMRGWGYVSKLVVGLVFLALGGAAAGRIARQVVTRPGTSLGAGFVVLAVVPVLSTLAMITVVPFPLGLLGFTLLGVALYLGQLVCAQAVGDLVLKRFRPDAWGSPFLSLAVGLVPLVLLTSVPWIGTLVWGVATVVGVGAVWLCLREVTAA